ncbi:MAG: hypothetical protein U0792_15850, partial [Gemmataceae bacterium]
MLPALLRTLSVPTTCAILLTAFASSTVAAPPVGAEERKEIAGQPTAIEIAPGDVKLSGVRDARQLVISGKYADGSLRDLTALADVKVEPADVVDLQEGVFLRPKKNGSATLTATAGGKQAKVAITVAGM